MAKAELVDGALELEAFDLLLDVRAELLDVQLGAVWTRERRVTVSRWGSARRTRAPGDAGLGTRD